MTRTTDPDPVPFQPLGKKVEPAKPKQPEWTTLPDNPQVQRDRDGHLRTNIPANERARWPADMAMIRADKR